MIRQFTVLCKLNQISFSDRQWFEWEAGRWMPVDHPCPFCSAKGCLHPFAHYERYLVEWEGQHPVSHLITVKRFLCDSCGHTHAGLPSCLVPYKSYSLRFILRVLRAYFLRPLSIEHICQHYGISVSTLYRWLVLFRQQKALWLGALEDAASLAAEFLDGLTGAILHDFFEAFRFSFLERIPRTDQEPPWEQSMDSGPFT